jgi:hypothetical protein
VPTPSSRRSRCAARTSAATCPGSLALLDRYGAAELDLALKDALGRGAVSAVSVAHVLDQRARARKAPPALDVVLPDDPRVRDLRITPHALDTYDALCKPKKEDK